MAVVSMIDKDSKAGNFKTIGPPPQHTKPYYCFVHSSNIVTIKLIGCRNQPRCFIGKRKGMKMICDLRSVVGLEKVGQSFTVGFSHGSNCGSHLLRRSYIICKLKLKQPLT